MQMSCSGFGGSKTLLQLFECEKHHMESFKCEVAYITTPQYPLIAISNMKVLDPAVHPSSYLLANIGKNLYETKQV